MPWFILFWYSGVYWVDNTKCRILPNFWGHLLWTLIVNTFCGHFLWTLFVNTFCGHFFWTLCGHFLLTLFVDTFCGHYRTVFFLSQKSKDNNRDKFYLWGIDWIKRHFILGLLQFAVLDNNKGFINLRFLQKLNWMKIEWGQARFSRVWLSSGVMLVYLNHTAI